MKILNREISEKTARLVSAIEQSVPLPVVYEIIKTEKATPYAGRVDTSGRNGCYTVWLNNTLPRRPYETDLLHELRHIVQIQNGFPTVYNKGNSDFHSPDRAFVEEVGAHLGSVVLDVEVNKWLKDIGYDYSFFTLNNYTVLLNQADADYPNWRDPLNRANIALSLVHAALYVDDPHTDTLFSKYSDRYGPIVEDASALRRFILSLGVLSPDKALLAQCKLIDSLRLWSHYLVISPSQTIRTGREFLAWRETAGPG